jgi:hypothetical protein
VSPTLHARIAAKLGWTEAEAKSFSLAALRELVRPTSPKLVAEIDETLHTGSHITRGV